MSSAGLELASPSEQHEDEVLRLEDQAARVYNRFVFRDEALSRRIRRRLYRENLAEFSPPHGEILLEDAQVVGMVSFLEGGRVRRLRLRAAMLLRKSGLLSPQPGVLRRMKAVSGAALAPGSGDLYLSRIAVAPAERGRGIGTRLLDRFESAARERGAERLVLNVNEAAEGAASFYRHAGYEEVGRGTAVDGGRSLTYLHMTKPVRDRSDRTSR